MSQHLFRQRKARAHEHCRPYDGMEPYDFLSHKVNVCRPVFIVELRLIRITQCCDIVCQRIKPYINYMLLINRNRNSPVKGGSGNTQIIQTLLDKGSHLVSPAFRLQEVRICLKEFQELVCIFGKFKEICFFLGCLYRSAAVRAASVHQLAFCPERLAWCAV